jgi:phosphatidylserine/phosphatidylglycerophosphate/cardiolipin synthase-like enzyme
MRHSTEVWLEMINNAKKSLNIGQFYIQSKPGQPMELIIQALVEAGKRGVNIRIVIDKMFYDMLYPQDADFLNKQKNIEVRQIDMGKITGGIMHAKYIVADDENVYLGSTNFDWLSLTNVHEIGVRLDNQHFAKYVNEVFETDWELCKKAKLPEFKGRKGKLPVYKTKFEGQTIKVTPVFSPESTTPKKCPVELDHIIDYIDSAKNSIFFNVMEYSCKSKYAELFTQKYDSAFRRAAARGVNVKILASHWSMVQPNVDYLKSISVLPNVEVKFLTIPRLKDKYMPFSRVQHCKYLMIDKEKSWLGSSNWEPDYFLRSRNVSILMEGYAATARLRQMFLNSWTSEYAQYIDVTKDYPKPQVMD